MFTQGITHRSIIVALIGMLLSTITTAQTYATLPVSDDLSSGSLGASWTVSDSQGMGTATVANLSGGWPNFGTCNASTCSSVGATSGNGLIVYNSSSPTGSNKINMDLHLDLSGMGTVLLEYAIVDWRSGWDSLVIYLSNDGGSSFSRASKVSLWLAPHTDGFWNEVSHDISALATATGESFSSSYVIRFANYLEFSGAASSPKNWPNQSIYYDNFKVTETVSLPVELLSFTGNETSQGTMLNWETASEINNSHFEVQKSKDGTTWRNIGNVEGAGNSFAYNNYELLDTEESTGTSYYRLKQVDYNGAYEFSNVISFNGGQNAHISVLDNGSSNPIVTLSGISKESAVKIVSIEGKEVSNYTSIADSAYDRISLDNLSSGSYMIIVNSGTEMISEKIVISQ